MHAELSKARIFHFIIVYKLYSIVYTAYNYNLEFFLAIKNLLKFRLREEDRESCIQSCILDASCLGYGHVFLVDCILIISNLGAGLGLSKIHIHSELCCIYSKSQDLQFIKKFADLVENSIWR